MVYRCHVQSIAYVLTISLPAGTTFVQALVQLGPEITAEPGIVRALLVRFNVTPHNPPQNSQVVEWIQSLARLASEGTVLPDVGSLVKALDSIVSDDRLLSTSFNG